eukprot:s4118_g1.t1
MVDVLGAGTCGAQTVVAARVCEGRVDLARDFIHFPTGPIPRKLYDGDMFNTDFRSLSETNAKRVPVISRASFIGPVVQRETMAIRGQTTPFGPYGGFGAADVEYEQFLKAKEVQRAMFAAENKTIVHQNADTDVIQCTEGSIACIDGNQAAAHVAYALSDCAFIYPITPSSPMGETWAV